ncbi:MAG: hypothetical protein MH321_14145, partial [Leptospiraceae bacterium]|nr:hypothetical protein [Leptospiraceae bacterium]
MEIYLIILFGIFLGSWVATFLPQILLYFPKDIPLAPKWAHGTSFLCFCTLKCNKIEFSDSNDWKRVARHEYCHQLQQRYLSPILFGILYLGEMIVRRVLYEKNWKSAYCPDPIKVDTKKSLKGEE